MNLSTALRAEELKKIQQRSKEVLESARKEKRDYNSTATKASAQASCKEHLGFKPHEWQLDTVEALFLEHDVVLVAGAGPGKTIPSILRKRGREDAMGDRGGNSQDDFSEEVIFISCNTGTFYEQPDSEELDREKVDADSRRYVETNQRGQLFLDDCFNNPLIGALCAVAAITVSAQLQLTLPQSRKKNIPLFKRSWPVMMATNGSPSTPIRYTGI